MSFDLAPLARPILTAVVVVAAFWLLRHAVRGG